MAYVLSREWNHMESLGGALSHTALVTGALPGLC